MAKKGPQSKMRQSSVSEADYKQHIKNAIINVWEAHWNDPKYFDACELILDENFHLHRGPGSMNGDLIGIEAYKKAVKMLITAFEDFKMVFEDFILDGDVGAIKYHWECKHTKQSDILPFPPSGKKIWAKGISFIKIKNGRVTDEWGLEDNLHFYQQLGVIPETPQPAEYGLVEGTWNSPFEA